MRTKKRDGRPDHRTEDAADAIARITRKGGEPGRDNLRSLNRHRSGPHRVRVGRGDSDPGDRRRLEREANDVMSELWEKISSTVKSCLSAGYERSTHGTTETRIDYQLRIIGRVLDTCHRCGLDSVAILVDDGEIGFTFPSAADAQVACDNLTYDRGDNSMTLRRNPETTYCAVQVANKVAVKYENA